MTPNDFDYLRDFLKRRSGLALPVEKRFLAETRLSPIVRETGLESLADLIAKIRADQVSPLATAVVEAMTTNESLFFRDKTPFENFRNVIVPALADKRKNEKRIRIWCAAAATGQEPYSLAMTLREHRLLPPDWQVEIIATDLSSAMIETARAGIYSQFEVQRGLPIQMLLKYFTQTGEMWQISPDIRSMVSFRVFNLLDSFARLGRFDVVFCRNVLIYFDKGTKISVLDRMAPKIAADGYLVLGAAETVVGVSDAFVPLSQYRGLYAPCDSTRLRPPPLLPRSPPLAPGMPLAGVTSKMTGTAR